MQQKAAHLIQRYNTAEVWLQNNPVLLLGEMGIESDTGKVKLGNGSARWNALDYFITGEAYTAYSAGDGVTLDPNTYVLTAAILYDVIGTAAPDE